MSVGVLVPDEDLTWSLTLVGVHVSDERTAQVAHARWCSCFQWGPHMVALTRWCSCLRWGPHMVAHAHWCSCSNSRRGPTWSLMPVGVRVPVSGEDHTRSLTPTIVRVLDPGEDRHGRSCPLLFMFQLPVRTTHGRLLPFVFLFPVRATWLLTRSCSNSQWGQHGRSRPLVFVFQLSARTVPVPGKDHTWSLMPLGVHAPREDRTWSLTPVDICVPVLGKDHTWLLMPVGVEYLVLSRIYKILWRWSKIFINNIPLSRQTIWEGIVGGGIMSRFELLIWPCYNRVLCVNHTSSI